ncbi:cobaltochelatase subunit CobN [Thalassolituus sp. LLYu03]|uniref:cobaltochelatase subunit CobN n=1 Tax=Thalassolituus sp. LLYu03 TaxID=3421656 RepID=UPI003D26D031
MTRFRSYYFLFVTLALLLAQQVTAAPLILISDRSAPRMVAAAHDYLQQHPHAALTVRTVSQLNQLNDEQLQQLVNDADRLLMLAVFGEPVERLLHLRYPSGQLRLSLNGDRRLLRLQPGWETLDDDTRDAITEVLHPGAGDQQAFLRRQQARFPPFALWLQMRSYWQNRVQQNGQSLLTVLLNPTGAWPDFIAECDQRFFLFDPQQQQSLELPAAELNQRLNSGALAHQPRVLILDHDSGDQAGEWLLHAGLCQRFAQTACISALAGWGAASQQATEQLLAWAAGHPALMISLQDFVIGGGSERTDVTDALTAAGIPVLRGIRVTDSDAHSYGLSRTGLPTDSVHYRIAMPELQGVSQPQVLALAGVAQDDALTGARISRSEPQDRELDRFVRRGQQWLALQQKPAAQKHVAIIYYNHPPGRHNIGADNLNVVESLWQILQRLQREGYDLGDPRQLPRSSDELLARLQQSGVNLPEDAAALQAMHGQVQHMTAADYRQWFNTLPGGVQAEMTSGPLAALHQLLHEQLATELSPTQRDTLRQRLEHSLHDIRYVLDGVRDDRRRRALALFDQLADGYRQQLSNNSDSGWKTLDSLQTALLRMQIEGLRGWGEAPGRVMVWDNDLLIPGVRFGNVFLGPQPPRGWELNEELLHANMTFPPPHQYLAFYRYLQHDFGADALIHLGRHSTYEFLPGRRTGLLGSDYPALMAGDIPGIYPYIVDGVGEGIQAKRRGLAVMVDHLTPALAATELYDGLLELRQLIESAEAAADSTTRKSAISRLRQRINELNLRDELTVSMDEELQVRGIGFDDVDDDFLLHETGHYLTHLQEKFMPLGLHVFGRDWAADAVQTMLASMAQDQSWEASQRTVAQAALQASPAAEMNALMAGLNGHFVAPGKGNDPVRTPDALPTGRNFYALDGSLLPTRTGFDVGRTLARTAAATAQNRGEKDAVILWASDAVRDEGAMVAFGLDLLGVQVVWNSRGTIKGIERLPLSDTHPQRRDVLFTTSGLFRDLYGEQLRWLDQAVLLALSASADTIRHDFPALSPALDAALQPVAALLPGDALARNEPLASNRVADNWVEQTRQALRAGVSAEQAGRDASLRVFGSAPGAYGAGINRLAERSSAWAQRSELADVFVQRMGHVYRSDDADSSGLQAADLFRRQLTQVDKTYLGRASNLYGLMDNNDAFDYLGGLNMAIEMTAGQAPQSFVVEHARQTQLTLEPLQQALLGELRGRFLNRQWIEPLMQQGYAGARTMGSEFVEYLWGWQVTSPALIDDWVWAEVKAVYLDDALNLGMKAFWADGYNRQVQTNVLAVMMVAIDKGFWQADETTQRELAAQLAANVIAYGIPGSGHTHANHPVYDAVKRLISPEQAAALEQVLAASRLPDVQPAADATRRIQEIELQTEAASTPPPVADQPSATEPGGHAPAPLWWLALVSAVLIMGAGWYRSRRDA